MKRQKNKKTKKPKTYWNHRILAFPDGEEMYFRVCDVHYTDGKPRFYSEGGTIICGNNMDELWGTIEKIMRLLVMPQPVLWGGDKFPKVYKEPKIKLK